MSVTYLVAMEVLNFQKKRTSDSAAEDATTVRWWRRQEGEAWVEI